MRKLIIAAGALACAVLGSGQAQAAQGCATVSFNPSVLNFTNTWDPINGSQVTLTMTATISSIKNSSATVKLILLDNDTAGTLRVGTTGPKYTIAAGATTYAFPSGTAVGTSGVQFTVPNGSNATITTPTLNVALPANSAQEDFTGGATFSEALKYTVECYGNNGGVMATDSLQAGPTINVTIPKLVSLTTASPQTINFGSFTQATQQLNVGLKSTSSVNVAVTSRDQMVLAGAPTPFPANSVIPYTMTLNGTTIANGSSLTNQTRAGVTGTSWPLILTLTNGVPVTGKIAGTYSDTITLTLTPGT